MSDHPAEPEPNPAHSQVRTIRHLVRLMQKYDLTAVDLVEGQTKIRLRRRGAEGPAPAPAASAPPTPARAEPEPAPAASAVSRGAVIPSPMVGTFYASPSPDAPPFVSVGSVVNDKTIVCIIEAMKVFTEIPAEVSGTIVEVLARSGQPVEFGQPLFRVSQE
jgi:acetyl-CoA carboxylase biotin carboxyl carrier protein